MSNGTINLDVGRYVVSSTPGVIPGSATTAFYGVDILYRGPTVYGETGRPVAITATVTCTDTFTGGFTTFTDDFNRADGAIGNGWVDLTAAITSLPPISSNRVVAASAGAQHGALRPRTSSMTT